MALVEIARFSDLTEAHVAASALQAQGVRAFLQNADWGQNVFYMQIAIGGFTIWTPASEADEAREFIRSHRTVDPEVLRWTAHPDAWAGAPLAFATLLLWWFPGHPAGWAVVALRRRFSWTRLVVVGLCAVMLAYVFWLIWTTPRYD